MTRYLIALVLTVTLLAFARRMSTRHEMTITTPVDGVTLTHKTVTENFGDGPVLIIKTPSTDNLAAIVFYSEKSGGHDKSVAMSVTPEGFTAKLEPLPKGQKWFYQIQVSKNGTPVAQFPKEGNQFIKFKGHVAEFIIIPHIFFMFATIFFGLMAVFTSFDLARGKGNLRQSVLFLLLTFICAFIGGIAFGVEVTRQTFGEGWGGWPIGHDITDTKTEVLLLFWLVTLVLSLNGLAGKRMIVSEKLYSFLVILSFIVTFITFLIPHSI